MKQNCRIHVRIDYFPWRPEAYELRADEILDLVVSAKDIEMGKERFVSAFLQYAREYIRNCVTYSKDLRRRHHLPYVERALELGTTGIQQMIEYIGEAELREMVSSHQEDGFWQRLCSEREDTFYKLLIRTAKECGLCLGKLTAEQENELVQQVLYSMEQEEKHD